MNDEKNNTGKENSGDCNSGDRNSGNWNSGFFNTDSPKVRIFNQETELKRENIDFPSWFYFDLIEWINSKDMSVKEKEEHPDYETVGGFLKVFGYKEAWRNSFDAEKDLDEIRKALALPNFYYSIFEEITGISKADFDKKLGLSKPDNKTVVKKIKELEKEIQKLKQGVEKK